MYHVRLGLKKIIISFLHYQQDSGQIQVRTILLFSNQFTINATVLLMVTTVLSYTEDLCGERISVWDTRAHIRALWRRIPLSSG